jgi:eukaryotic-like serine/threonine-protein kinase
MSMSQVGSGLPRLLAERYELSERLASSGMTSIWRGHDRVLGRDVAIKVLHPELAADPTFRARFSEEAVNAARLTHPNIVALYDTGEQEGVAYIVSEWVEGANLASLLVQRGPLPPPQAARLASDVAMALDYAHGAGVVHGNLRSSNILITLDGTMKVGDFSIAKAAASEDPDRTGEILGSTHHLAPEQLDSESVDGRTDVYALGVCLFEMLTGRPPPAANDGQHPSLRSPRSLRAGIPRDLDGVVTRAMAPEPGKRFQTAADMATALARSAADDDTDPDEVVVLAASPAPAPPRSARVADPLAAPRRRGWLGWALVLVGMAAVAVAVAVVLIQGIGAGRNTPPSTPGQGQTATTLADGTTLRVKEAYSFDPYGSASPGDPEGQENEGKADRAIDEDQGTSWETARYNDEDLTALKPGVGLILELNSPAQAQSLELDVPSTGAEVKIYGADSRPDKLEGWEPPLAGPQEIEETHQVIRLNAQGAHRYYLIWFTQLPKSQDGVGYRGVISEAVLRS